MGVVMDLVMGVVLACHIAAGATGLVLGPLALRAPKRRGRHTRAGTAYQWTTAVLAATSVALAAAEPRLWWLGLIGVATEAAALGGWWLARRRPAGWVRHHVGLMCGSYVSYVTAFLVVNSPSPRNPIPWILPTVIATPLIARAAIRAATSEGNPVPA